jgi:urease accessory protein
LRLSFRPQDGRTVLAGCYSEAPFGTVRANYPDASGIPEVQITNPSGGILGGDYLKMEVTLSPDSAATVLTQAANRIYRGAEARQNAIFYVGGGGFLEYLPHHLIPFRSSNYGQEAEFYVAGDATLHVWDAVSAGRVACGERFAFDRLSVRTRIFRESLPEIADGFELSAGGEPFGGYSYMGVMYVLAPRDLGLLAQKLHAALSDVPRLLSSASCPAPRLCVARMLAHDAVVLYRVLNGCRAEARAYLDLPPAARELR